MCDSVPSMQYASVCNVLHLLRILLIPTYRVCGLYDICAIFWAIPRSENIPNVLCICWAQSMDLHNPWIAQRKPWIHILCNTHGLHAQSMDRMYLRAHNTNSRTIHGLRCVCKQLIAWFAHKSSPTINYRSQV